MKENEIKLFIDSNFKESFYNDVLKSRSYFLVLRNIVENNKHDIFSEISFCALIESLVLSVCRMYDFGSGVGCIQKVVNESDELFHKLNYDISKDINSDEKEELIKLVGINGVKTENYSKLLSYRDKFIAHKDSNWKEMYNSLRKCKLLELVEPFISFAEKIYDKNSYGEREEQIYNIRRYIEMEG